jgi:DNA (cytosine-5)-methyltransferase 1
MLVTVAHETDKRDADPYSRRAHDMESPLGAIHGEGSSYAVVEPFILNRHGDGYGETRAHSVEEPTPTSNCDGGGYLVEPFVLSRQGGGAPRSVDEPTPAQVAKHSHLLVTSYYGASQGGAGCSDGEDPLPTVTVKDRFGIVVPVTHSQGGNGARDVSDPLPTMTTAKGGEFAVVMPVTHAGGLDRARDASEPLPTITGANRGELAFIAAQFGEREGQAPRVHDIDQPTPTIAATGHINLVEATPAYDILFRMLEPHELAAAMGFNDGEIEYEFAGTKTEKIKQIGNAVSVSKMKACVGAIMADASPGLKPMRQMPFREAAE